MELRRDFSKQIIIPFPYVDNNGNCVTDWNPVGEGNLAGARIFYPTGSGSGNELTGQTFPRNAFRMVLVETVKEYFLVINISEITGINETTPWFMIKMGSGYNSASTASAQRVIVLNTLEDKTTTAADLVSINGTSLSDATLNLKQLNITNPTGDAVRFVSTGDNGNGFYTRGSGKGSGQYNRGGGDYIASGVTNDGYTSGDGVTNIGGSISGSGMTCYARTSGAGIEAIGHDSPGGLIAKGDASGISADGTNHDFHAKEMYHLTQMIKTIIDKLPDGIISNLSLDDTIDGESLKHILQLTMAMVDGEYTIEDDEITFHNRQNNSTLTKIKLLPNGRVRTL